MSNPAQSTSARAERAISRCRELARCTEVEGETTRPFLAPSMHRVHELISGWMRAAGIQVRVDPIGNLRGLLPGPESDSPRLLIGSHLDTVKNAGAFDGVLGVILGLEVVEELARMGTLPFAIEIIGFSEEEGVRFSKPFLGSLAVIGEVNASLLALTDRAGLTVAQAIRDFGLDPGAMASATLDHGAFAYLEFHIEQGPVLESEGLGLGVVEAIAGQTRMQLTFTGHANHAGTTPMGSLRRDAVAAAAEWILEVERYATGCTGLVATVGKVEVPSGAGNVIAARCIATLDVRHGQDAARRVAVAHLLAAAETAAYKRGVTVSHVTGLEQNAVPMDPALADLLATSALRATGTTPRCMTSGAGHDAMIVARRVPSAMLFLRSPGGLSHHPDEAVLAEDVEAALATGVEFLQMLRGHESIHPECSKREDIHA